MEGLRESHTKLRGFPSAESPTVNPMARVRSTETITRSASRVGTPRRRRARRNSGENDSLLTHLTIESFLETHCNLPIAAHSVMV